MKLQVGNVNKCIVDRKTDIGYMLKGLEHFEEVFLHQNDAAGRELQVGEIVQAFLFYDHKGRVAASLDAPYITTVDCDFVTIVDVLPHGVYCDIGIRRDVLLSKDDLPYDRAVWPQKGDRVFAYLKTDRDKALLIDLATREDFIDLKISAKPEVYKTTLKVRVFRVGAEGVNVIAEDERYLGFIHHSEYKEEPRLGSLIEARVIMVKENGELNLSLLPQKEIALEEDAEAIYDYLLQHHGHLPLSDKSSPEEIHNIFKISKAAFKRAVGNLLKRGIIKQNLEDSSIELIDKTKNHAFNTEKED